MTAPVVLATVPETVRPPPEAEVKPPALVIDATGPVEAAAVPVADELARVREVAGTVWPAAEQADSSWEMALLSEVKSEAVTPGVLLTTHSKQPIWSQLVHLRAQQKICQRTYKVGVGVRFTDGQAGVRVTVETRVVNVHSARALAVALIGNGLGGQLTRNDVLDGALVEGGYDEFLNSGFALTDLRR